MKITVHFGAQLANAAGLDEESVEVEDGVTYRAFLRILCDRYGERFEAFVHDEKGELHLSLLAAINDRQVEKGKDVALADGDTMTLLSPMAGG
ncbi:MAG: MoaD/ThiS family protein [Verrucomicrobiota bacterium]